ncbi:MULTISPECIES: hypothetical protein [unclassified Nostoc]|nr:MULTISPECIES: hypothetical protein [unclassified Nostoc]
MQPNNKILDLLEKLGILALRFSEIKSDCDRFYIKLFYIALYQF